jgi:hypothetical protein
MTRIKGQSGQSVYDMAMICYGDLGMLTQLMVDSGIEDLANISANGRVFLYDDSKIQNPQLVNAIRKRGGGVVSSGSLDTTFTNPYGRAFSNGFNNGFA